MVFDLGNLDPQKSTCDVGKNTESRRQLLPNFKTDINDDKLEIDESKVTSLIL